MLAKDERKEFLLNIIAFASNISKFDKVEHIIDSFILEFKDEIELDIYHNLLLSKANAAAQNQKFNLANSIYKTIISFTDATAGTKAWAYQGLSKISIHEKDIIYFTELAYDRFLESGYKSEAIKNIVHLSHLFENKDPNAANRYLDEAINLYDDQKIIDKEFIASLYHKKGLYCYSINNISEGLEFAEKACFYRETLFGNEYEKYSCYRLAEILANLLQHEKKYEFYHGKAEELINLIQNDGFFLQRELEIIIGDNQKLDTNIISKIESSNFDWLKFSMYLYLAINKELSFEKRLEMLDKAKIILRRKKFSNQDYSLIHFAFGELYRNENMLDDAFANYKECLKYNPFYTSALQNCGAMLWHNKAWDKAVSFFKEQIDKLGELPNLSFAYARSLFENGNIEEAFEFFKKCQGNIKNVYVQKYLLLCIEKSKTLTLNTSNSVSTLQRSTNISLNEFKEALNEFSYSISSDSRMHFWEINKNTKQYKWKACPEETGKQMLITYLNGKFGKNRIEIIQENRAGAGIIDLYLILTGGLKIVLELKICGGAGYSSNYALSGENQIVHYLDNKPTKIGFLLVFDGRLRDYSKCFKPVQAINDFTIYTIAIDMRPVIKES